MLARRQSTDLNASRYARPAPSSDDGSVSPASRERAQSGCGCSTSPQISGSLSLSFVTTAEKMDIMLASPTLSTTTSVASGIMEVRERVGQRPAEGAGLDEFETEVKLLIQARGRGAPKRMPKPKRRTSVDSDANLQQTRNTAASLSPRRGSAESLPRLGEQPSDAAAHDLLAPGSIGRASQIPKVGDPIESPDAVVPAPPTAAVPALPIDTTSVPAQAKSKRREMRAPYMRSASAGILDSPAVREVEWTRSPPADHTEPIPVPVEDLHMAPCPGIPFELNFAPSYLDESGRSPKPVSGSPISGWCTGSWPDKHSLSGVLVSPLRAACWASTPPQARARQREMRTIYTRSTSAGILGQ
jgi:hypothetical protein